MTFDASLNGKIKWTCDICGKEQTEKQSSYHSNMTKRELSFIVTPPSGWNLMGEWHGTFGMGDVVICPLCNEEISL
jgi:hypothetical protein